MNNTTLSILALVISGLSFVSVLVFNIWHLLYLTKKLASSACVFMSFEQEENEYLNLVIQNNGMLPATNIEIKLSPAEIKYKKETQETAEMKNIVSAFLNTFEKELSLSAGGKKSCYVGPLSLVEEQKYIVTINYDTPFSKKRKLTYKINPITEKRETALYPKKT